MYSDLPCTISHRAFFFLEAVEKMGSSSFTPIAEHPRSFWDSRIHEEREMELSLTT